MGYGGGWGRLGVVREGRELDMAGLDLSEGFVGYHCYSITNNYRQICLPNKKMSFVVSIIVEILMNKIA